MPHFRIALPLAVALSAIVAPGLAAGLDWVRVAPTADLLSASAPASVWSRGASTTTMTPLEDCSRTIGTERWPGRSNVRDLPSTTCRGSAPTTTDAVYWSFTTTLVKTDANGKVLKKIAVASHHGDLCFHDGKVYVAVNLGTFNDPQGKADSWVYVYDAGDLSLLAKHATQEVFHGAGGIGCRGGRFFVVGGLPEGIEENYVYEYDKDFKFVGKHVIKSGWTSKGIQTAAFSGGQWWFGCYGAPPVMLKTDESLRFLGRFEVDCSLGVVGLPNGRFLVARGSCQPGAGCRGSVIPAEADDQKGLVIQNRSGGEGPGL